MWPVGKFEDGVFETDDPAKIEVLMRSGYKHDSEVEPEPKDEPIEGQIEIKITPPAKAPATPKAVAPAKKVTK